MLVCMFPLESIPFQLACKDFAIELFVKVGLLVGGDLLNMMEVGKGGW